MKTLLYFTGPVLSCQQTGGMKRFIELAKYVCNSIGESVFCSLDEEHVIKSNGFDNFVTLSPPQKDKYGFLFPEIGILLENLKIIKSLKKMNFEKTIVFDVPMAIGLCLLGFHHIILLIRKDMIGYEVAKTKNKSVKFYLKLVVQWLAESICLLKAERIITQCDYDLKAICNRHFLLKKIILKKSRIQINNVNPSWAIRKEQEQNKNNSDIFRVCYIGDFNDNRKGHDLLLPVAEKLTKTYANIEFFIIGGGLEENVYKKKYGNSKIQFKGRLLYPIEELVKCDLLVVPSLADSCPNTIMEALYNDILVIGSCAGGIPEILNFEEGLFDLNEMAIENKIEALFLYDNERIKLRELEQKRKKELTFDWPHLILSKIY